MASFPADTLLRNAVDSVFSLNHNGEQLPVTRVAASSRPQVQVRGVGILRKDGMKEFQVACFQPIGSVFRFLSDDSATVGRQERAPSGLVYLSAGISFCFMTQLGRYAHVAKHDMHSYQIVQDTSFSPPSALNEKSEIPTSAAVDTDVFIRNTEDEEKTQTLLNMGEGISSRSHRTSLRMTC